MTENKKIRIKFINTRIYIIILVSLLFFSGLLNIMFFSNVIFATTFYENISVKLKYLLSAFSAKFNVSIADIAVFILIAVVCFSCARLVIYFVKSKKAGNSYLFTYRLKKTLLNFCCFLAVSFMIFTLAFMPVYNRLDFMIYNNIHSASIDEEYLDRIAESANSLSNEITGSGQSGINENTFIVTLNKLALHYPCLGDFYVAPKKSIFFAGYVPFTNEVCHKSDSLNPSEVIDIMEGYACSSGFVSASDRQYIAVSACLKSDNAYLKYCGILAVINTVNKNYPDKNITALLNQNVIKDMDSLSSGCTGSYLPELNSIL